MTYIRNISRLLVGAVFIFSGIVKGVDPLGTAYRIDDYFIAYGTEWAIPLALFLSVSLCALEFVLGISLILNAWIKRMSWPLFLMMIFFTILTLADAIWEPVPDCGCFGDAITLSNWATFYKNIVLIILVGIIFFQRKKFKPVKTKAYGLVVLSLFSIAFVYFSMYNLNHLPMMDFREWKVGTNMDPEGGSQAKIYLLYRNTETGEIKEYLSPDYPWQDSVWMSKWEFLNQRVDDSDVIRSHNLIIEDKQARDLTDEIISNPEYQFIVVAYDVSKTNRDVFNSLYSFYKEAYGDGYLLIALTSSLPTEVEEFYREQKLDRDFEFFYGDDVVLKTMIRANPGLILMKEGIVLGKWHYNDIPDYEDVKEEYMQN